MSDLFSGHRNLPAREYSGLLPQVSSGGGHYPPSADGATEASTRAIHPLNLLLWTFRRHVWLILGVTALTVGVAAFLVSRQKPLYMAKAAVQIKDVRRAMVGRFGGDAAAAQMGVTDPLASQIQVLRSRNVAAVVVDSTGFRLRPESSDFSPAQLTGVRVDSAAVADTLRLSFLPSAVRVRTRGGEVIGGYGMPVSVGGVHFAVPSKPAAESAVLTVASREDAINEVLGGIDPRPRPTTDFVDIRYTSDDPHRAQFVANAVAEAFQQVSLKMAAQESRRRRRFLEEQLGQTKADLARAQDALTGFRSREGVYTSSREKASAEQAGGMELDMRRAQMQADRQMYQQLLSGLGSRRGGGRALRALVSSPGIAANPVVSQRYAQLIAYQTSRDTLIAAGSAPSHPDVQRLNTLIVSAEGELVDAVRSHVASLDAQIGALGGLQNRSSAQIQVLPQTEAQEIKLTQQVETINKLADQLAEEYQKARIEEAVEAGQVEIVDRAVVPGAPIGMGSGVKLGVALVLGLLFGLGSAILAEGMNTAITRREELETVLAVPGLAVIPRIASSSRPSRGRLLAAGSNGRSLASKKKDVEGLVTVTDFHSTGAEAYRTLRTNLIFSQSGEPLKTLVVTSSSPAEGKSTTAANLAAAYAQQGIQVLLVDADMRRARLHDILQVPREPGLTNLLLGHKTADETIRRTSVDGLSFLAAGTFPPNPSELLGGQRMREMISNLSGMFDLVLFDTPPLLAAADAAILATRVDGVVMVVRAGQTQRGAAQQALQQLATVGARVIGAVLNDPDAKVPRYAGYYAYDYYGEESVREEENTSAGIHG